MAMFAKPALAPAFEMLPLTLAELPVAPNNVTTGLVRFSVLKEKPKLLPIKLIGLLPLASCSANRNPAVVEVPATTPLLYELS